MQMMRSPWKRKVLLPLAGSLLLLVLACEKVPPQEQSKPAAEASATPPAQVQPGVSGQEAPFLQAVDTYLQKVKNIDTSLMTIQLEDLKVVGETATAKVVYGAKKGDMPPMTYLYDFARKDGAWTVLKSQPAGGDGHGGMGMPPGMGGAPAGDLPPGHPPLEGAMPSHQPGQGQAKEAQGK
jgi:hypothetical protein